MVLVIRGVIKLSFQQRNHNETIKIVFSVLRFYTKEKEDLINHLDKAYNERLKELERVGGRKTI